MSILVSGLTQSGSTYLVLTVLYFLFCVTIEFVAMVTSKEIIYLCLLFDAQSGIAFTPDIFFFFNKVLLLMVAL